MNEPAVTVADFTSPPEGSSFSLQKVEKVSIPHPYCITAKHVVVASDQFGGILGVEAIRAAEEQGARCGTPRCTDSYDKHTTSLALFIAVPQNRDLNAIPGLNDYLVSIKPRMVELGIEGIAFPKVGK